MTSERLSPVTVTWPRADGRFYPSGPARIIVTREDGQPLDVAEGMVLWNADGVVLARLLLAGDDPDDGPREYTVTEMRIAP